MDNRTLPSIYLKIIPKKPKFQNCNVFMISNFIRKQNDERIQTRLTR